MPRPRKQLSVSDWDVAQQYRAGAPIAELARRYGVDRYVIRRIVGEHAVDEGGVVVRLASHVPPGCVTATELAERALLTSKQVEHWTRVGVLRPRERTPRAGMPWVFPVSEVQVASLTRRLARAGVHVREANALARDLADTGTSTLAGMRLELLDYDAARYPEGGCHGRPQSGPAPIRPKDPS